MAFYTVVLEFESPVSGEDLVLTLMMEGPEQKPEVSIPEQFLFDETEYALDIIVQQESGNRSVGELEFETS